MRGLKSPSQRVAFVFGLVALSLVLLYIGIEVRGSIFSMFLILAFPFMIGYSIYELAQLFYRPETPVDWSVPMRNNMDGAQYDLPTTENLYGPNMPEDPRRR